MKCPQYSYGQEVGASYRTVYMIILFKKKTGKIDTEVSAGCLGERIGFVGGKELSFLNYAF